MEFATLRGEDFWGVFGAVFSLFFSPLRPGSLSAWIRLADMLFSQTQ